MHSMFSSLYAKFAKSAMALTYHRAIIDIIIPRSLFKNSKRASHCEL